MLKDIVHNNQKGTKDGMSIFSRISSLGEKLGHKKTNLCMSTEYTQLMTFDKEVNNVDTLSYEEFMMLGEDELG